MQRHCAPVEQVPLEIRRQRDVIVPYSMGTNWHLVQGNCLEVMASIPDQSIDCAVCDPPYFLSNGGTTVQSGERVAVDKGQWDRSKGTEGDHLFHRAWLGQVRSVLKPSGTVWVFATHHALFSIGFAMQTMGFHVLNLVTWEKASPPPNLGCRSFTHSAEMIIWAAPAELTPLRHVYNDQDMRADNCGKQMRDVWKFGAPKKAEKIHGRHPAQKPQSVLDRMIRASTSPGDLILDPFCGSASTGVAALRLGRRFIGIEADPDHISLAHRRMSA